MVYINPDGTITHTQPWGINKIVGLFYGLITFVILFFKSLVGLDNVSSSSSSRGTSSNFRGWGGGGGGGGGGGRPGGGGPGPGGKRFFTMKDIAPPSVGGCPGGSCSRF